jgi:GNAT superfamily N-acetyltransferase
MTTTTASVRLLNRQQALEAIPALSDILVDGVEGGASLGFMSPLSIAEAPKYWKGIAGAVGRGEILLFASEIDGRIVGTVQVGFAMKPNQPHRGDLMKLLVHSAARGRGISRLLMEAAERESAKHGRWLLVLDTATGSPAEEIYARFGWQRSGVIPDYALYPDGSYCSTTIFYKRVAA